MIVKCNLCRYFFVSEGPGICCFTLTVNLTVSTVFLSAAVCNHHTDRAIGQAVSRRLPNAAAWVRTRFKSCRICWWRKWHWGKFSPSTSVPLPIRLPPTAPKSSYIILGCYSRPNSSPRTKWTHSLTPSEKKEQHYYIHMAIYTGRFTTSGASARVRNVIYYTRSFR
jgi:hypothetical protein